MPDQQHVPSLESALSETEVASLTAINAASALVTACRVVAKAASIGDLTALRRGLERVKMCSQTTAQEVASLQRTWALSPSEEEHFLRTSYEDELVAEASSAGLDLRRIDGQLVSFPSVLRLAPGHRVLDLNRQKVSALRPSYVVNLLKRARDKKPRHTPEQFLEILYAAYVIVVDTGGGGTTLAALYDVLTLMPEIRRDYTPLEFARDLYELDRSGVVRTRAGARVSLPASTGTKQREKVFKIIAPTGEPISFYAIRFAL